MGCHCGEKKIIKTENAPKAVGPYSVGVMGSNLLFTSGQLGLDPKSQELVAGGISSETEQAILNIKNILESAGSSLEKTIKVTVFIKDLYEFQKMNEVYGKYFSDMFPARSAVQVAGLPKGAAVMIDAVAVIPCDCDCDCEDGSDCSCNCIKEEQDQKQSCC